MTNIAVIYYSSTGNVHALAEAVAEGATKAGAEVRLRRVAELAPAEAIDANDGWRAHADATAAVPVASLDDLRWADGFAFGSPTRYGNVSAQLKQFLDTTGPLWAAGELSDKVATGSRARSTRTAATSRRCWRSTTRCTTGVRSWSPRATPTSRSPRRAATRTALPTPPATAFLASRRWRPPGTRVAGWRA